MVVYLIIMRKRPFKPALYKAPQHKYASVLLVLLCLGLSLCARPAKASSDESPGIIAETKEAGKEVGQSVKEAVSKEKLKETGHEIKEAGKETGHTLKEAGRETKETLKETGREIKEGLKDLTKSKKKKKKKTTD